MRASYVIAALTVAALWFLATQTWVPPPVGLSVFDPANGRPTLDAAERHFVRGVELRGDAAKARPEFAQAATRYDDLWRRTFPGRIRRDFRSPDLALNRARAHRLAGDLPRSILSLHDGLAATPASRELQAALSEARAAVAYPAGGALEAECRPTGVLTVGSRMSPREGGLLAGGLWLAACLAVTRFVMTRRGRWLAASAACLAGLAALGGLWWHDARVRAAVAARPLAVVAADAVLRTGNAESYPARFASPLPAGVEVRVLGDRGGWLHVELAGGAAGWLPAAVVR